MESCGETTRRNFNYSELFQYSQLFYLADDFHKVLFLPIPKTGCSTWKMAILNNTQTAGPELKGVCPHNKKIIQKYGLRMFRYLTLKERAKLFESYYKVLTVRHPLDRLESAYTDKIVFFNQSSHKYVIGLLTYKYGEGNFSTKDLHQYDLTFDDFLPFAMKIYDRHWGNFNKVARPCVSNFR